MGSNDQVILDQVLNQRKSQLAPSLSDADFFEVFTAEQLLKTYDLSYEELEDGLVDGGGDGGLDSMYIFANGELVREDFDLAPLKRGVLLDVVMIQAKRTAGFSETAVDKLRASFGDLFDLSRSLDDFKTLYNPGVLAVVRRFRDAHSELASRFPRLSFRVAYATRGLSPHPNVEKKADQLRERIREMYSGADASVDLVGADQLLELARTATPTSFKLALAEAPISASGDVGFIALVKLTDFFGFLTDTEGGLRKSLFESNVRDYQGSTQVNDQIQGTLKAAEGEDFWWLNNGVTVVASKAVLSSKTLTIEDPQIVNGLQTSTEIYKYFKESNTVTEDRHCLVRVIVPSKAESRDRVIKATNSQTAVQPASLRATDKIQRDIEEYFKAFGLFYDRRKNFYKNDGKPVENIVSISALAQAVMAVLLQRPDTARARPSSLLKNDTDYSNVFDDKRDVATYRVAAVLLKSVDSHLRGQDLSPKDRTNIRFYVAMHWAATLCGKASPTAADLCSIDLKSLDDVLLQASADKILMLYRERGANDETAKGPALLAALKAIMV